MQRICLGTVQFGLNYGIANDKGKPLLSEVEEIIKLALKNNVTSFDTAQSYGDSEKVIGKVFEKLNCHDKVKITTKSHPDLNFENRDSLLQSLEYSKTNLGVKQLWGLMLHRPSQLKTTKQFNRNIEYIKKEGLVKNVGVSVYTPEEAILTINHPLTDIIQVPFNILDRRLIDIDFFRKAKEKNKIVFIRSVFLQGLLLMDDDMLIKKGMDWALPYLKDLNNFLKTNKLNKSIFSLKSIANYQKDATIILGVDTKKQLEQNLNYLSDSSNIDNEIEMWWKKLPQYPERLVNPSLW